MSVPTGPPPSGYFYLTDPSGVYLQGADGLFLLGMIGFGDPNNLDGGGFSRQWTMNWMGPTVGWVAGPLQNVLSVTFAGTYTLDLSISLVEVAAPGPVTINLPPAMNPRVSAGVLPGRYVKNPITVIDAGGTAAASNITINPAAGETVMGLASIKIATNYGGFTLQPVPAHSTWTSISP